MGLFHHDSEQAQAYNQVVHKPHEAEWSHELIASAASYEAAKAYEVCSIESCQILHRPIDAD